MIGEGAAAGKVGTTNPLTPEALTNGMYTFAHTNLDGMTPTLTFTPGKAQVNRCWFWSSVSTTSSGRPRSGLRPLAAPRHLRSRKLVEDHQHEGEATTTLAASGMAVRISEGPG